ncbi:GNAT family N-acetyltransferase [Pseudomonas sp. MUP55]|uniref:GNAT family N-acetyltransferase n=1 Tax=Pseudomonas sp. MUP55 TaxID=3087234 RepID=UPI002A5A4CEF|nr:MULTISPECIES: GNAT family N-acetyltransferase [unclassified Pseudomonas]WPN91073.1 GNAT family N-acetyltransferase [Pseudomonas sp. MUP56]WPN96599.1 GNAT family N-acetyltransferase [Pseudomonas sp. MUP55]
MEYSGEGFFLRALTSDDCELINRYEKANRGHLQRWEPLRDEQYFTAESARARVQEQLESMQAAESVFFLLLEPESGELLGRCNYTNIVRGVFQACNLGFSLAEVAQGRGLMRKTLQITNSYCFEQVGLHRIMANHLPSNVRSERLLQSLGFEREGYARAYLKIAGAWQDHVLRSLINPR